MSVEHDHVFCDGCPPGGSAVVPIASAGFDAWRVIEMEDGPDTHLCPRCADRLNRGLPTGYAFAPECRECGGRTTAKVWWVRKGGGRLCDDCNDAQRT